MILNPAVITLILVSLLTAAFAVYASTVGYRILRDWDIASGSEGQLALERETYLVSSVLTHLFAVGLFSMFFSSTPPTASTPCSPGPCARQGPSTSTATGTRPLS